MRRHGTHLDRHSRHHSKSQRHSIAWDMEAAWEDTSNANGCRPNECLLIEMRHDRYMNMHNAPPASTCNICCMKMISIHHTLSHILSWYHSDIYQDVSPEPQSTKLNEQSICWLEMYGQPDIEVVFLVAIPGPSTSGLKIAQEPSVDIVLRPAFHLKTASWEYFDYVFWLQRSDNWYVDWFGTLTLRFSSFPFELCHVFAFGL